MTQDQLRKALSELNGERDATFALSAMDESCSILTVRAAMLIPDEGDSLIKVTDGSGIYIIDAAHVVWVRIGLKEQLSR